MSLFLQNPLPEQVLTFYKVLTDTKNSVRLISRGPKRGVCLHYETQLTQTKSEPIVKIRKQEIYIKRLQL
ncbi:hypothetical protein A4D02_25095 [Niastella koreensis]|uniref:Uncharacterized protein n=2 Tax=Niastella koreensis TaxID=354356 RepID=G8TQ00_NIAKG|nr:hypothetical protein Niako_3696 [Niastella koreensis GR20-10]OQP51404.1 hypothetical protein A4D02_25095 [Niastella koreensis]